MTSLSTTAIRDATQRITPSILTSGSDAFVATDFELGKIVFEIGEVLSGMRAHTPLPVVMDDVHHFEHVVELLTRAHKQAHFSERLQQAILKFCADVQQYDRVVIKPTTKSFGQEIFDASAAAKKSCDEVMKLLATECAINASPTHSSRGRIHSAGTQRVSMSWYVRENEVNLLDAMEPRADNVEPRVYKAVYAGISVAVRVYDASNWMQSEKIKQQLTTSLEIWQRLHPHAHILRLYGASDMSEKPFVVMELCDGGSLVVYLRRHEISRPVLALEMLIHAGEGLLRMHSLGIVHNDFKAANVLVNTATKQAKLSSFDRSFDWVELERKGLVDGKAGAAGIEVSDAVRWLAPECIQGSVPTTASDVYAFGLALYEALTGEIPYFSIKQDDEVEACVLAHELPARDIQGISDGAWKLIKMCCDRVPHERPTMEEVLRLLRGLSISSRHAADMLGATLHASMDVHARLGASVSPKDVSVVLAPSDPKQLGDYTLVKAAKPKPWLKQNAGKVAVLVVVILAVLGVTGGVVGKYFSSKETPPIVTPMPTPEPTPFVSTIAGTGSTGGFAFRKLNGIVVSLDGNTIYFSDENRILRLKIGEDITVYAGGDTDGKDDGDLVSATFSEPGALALNSLGDLFVCDTGNHAIRKITKSTGMVSKFTDEYFTDATGIAIDWTGVVYVADGTRREYAQISSDGSSVESWPMQPETMDVAVAATGVVVTADGTKYFTVLNAVFAMSPDGTLTILAGTTEYAYVDGPGTDARFSGPSALAMGSDGNLYIADTGNHCIRKLTLRTNVVTTYAGMGETDGSTDGPATAAQFQSPVDIAARGNMLYVVDGEVPNQRVRRIYVDK